MEMLDCVRVITTKRPLWKEENPRWNVPSLHIVWLGVTGKFRSRARAGSTGEKANYVCLLLFFYRRLKDSLRKIGGGVVKAAQSRTYIGTYTLSSSPAVVGRAATLDRR